MAVTKKVQPADPSDAQSLDDFLCFAIYSTNLAVNRLNKPVLDELGLTYLQYVALVLLYEHNDQTVSSLSDKLFLESSTLTPLLKRLEAMGHVTRQRDPQDERVVKVNITPKGRKVREKALDYREQLVEKMGLSATDFQNLREELVKLRTNLSDSETGKS
ncbi:MAG: MarR family transcriptional regulator, organic hydroperoxide resistance regulator [Gammaproteobacteria bacterium]|jgi:DNA-binding MarR family transcriptional regulator|nr:MarR family transcriptional regulator, organic hydroperoxide resistance regulator [Gammaproteobacteria bacterium]